MTPTETAYLAGLIDGEGSILLAKLYRGGTPRRYWSLKVEIAMTHQPTIQRVADIVAYNDRQPHVEKRTRVGWKDIYRWQVSGARAAEVIRNLLPYLVTKREQALVALEYAEMGSAHQGRLPMSDAEVARRQELYDRMAALNRRGEA